MRRSSLLPLVMVAGALVIAPLARADEPPPIDARGAGYARADLDDPVNERIDLGGRIRLGAPLGPPRDSFFHAPLLLPRFMPARTGLVGQPTLRLGTAHTESARSEVVKGIANRFDGLFHEWLRLDLTWPVAERVELILSTRVAGWDERRDVFRLYSGGPLPSVHGEDRKLTQGDKTSRHDNVADITLGGKIELWRGEDELTAIAIAALVKLPIARHADLTHAGTIDLSFVALGSLEVGHGVVLHANAGFTYPTGSQSIFDDDRVDADPFAHGTIGITWMVTEWASLGAGLDAATSAWSDVPILDEPTASVFAGARFARGGFELELGGGTGLTDASPDWLFWIGVGYTFGRDDPETVEAGGGRRSLEEPGYPKR